MTMKTLITPAILLVLLSAGSIAFAEKNADITDQTKDSWIELFNGKDFSGWKIDKWNPDSFSVEEGQSSVTVKHQ